MTALFPVDGEMPIPMTAQIACVEREIRMRVAVYGRRVQEGRMKEVTADSELAAMRAVLATLKAIAEGEA